jgi:hypothetical protein
MKRLCMAALLLGSAMISTEALAVIRVYNYSGTVCQPVSGATTSVDYSQFGIQNNSASAITVECPLNTTVLSSELQTTFGSAIISGYDRSTTSNVSCTLQTVDSAGNVTFSMPGSSSGGGPGSGPTGILSFSQVPPGVADGYWRLRCTIPGVQSGWASHVTSITLNFTE